MRFLIIISCAVLLVSVASYANCSDLLNEVKEMRTAQSSVHASLISNHAMFASVLESYSEAVMETQSRGPRALSSSMASSAESFRARGLKAQKTATKLDEATDSLIQKLTKCLK